MTEYIGFVAAFMTTLAFLPQVIKTYQLRSAKDLSLSTFSILAIGLVMWLIYGLLMNDMPIILANFFTLLLALSLLVMKFVFK
ncbi:MAG: SemiSWEET family sugar transporter [Cyclobacteriaceae bacterium]